MSEAAQIFVSYKRDDKAFVADLVQELEDSGFSVWWDTRITAGSEFDNAIETALNGAVCVVVVWSQNSVDSEWVKNEANEGLRRNILIPVRIDDVDPPLAFRRRQTIDILGDESLDDVTEAVAAVLESATPDIETAPASHRHSRKHSSFRSKVHLVYAVLILGILITCFWLWPNTPTTDLSGVQLPLSLQHFSRYVGNTRKLALSPDGQQLAYVGLVDGETHLFVQNLDTHRSSKFPGTEGAGTPFFSPNGNWIGFYAHGKLKRSPATGGNPIEIAAIRDLRLGANWGDDDYIVFSSGYRNPLSRVKASGGEIEPVTTIEEGGSHRHPIVLPGSNAILYQKVSGTTATASIWVIDLRSGESQHLIEGAFPRYYNGKLLFLTGGWVTGSIRAVDFDPATLTISGDPIHLFDKTHSPFAISNNGTLAYSSLSSYKSNLLLLDQLTGETRVIANENSTGMALSPDGKLLAVPRTLNDQINIWIYDLDIKGSESQLSFEGGEWPIWSPDGTQVAYWQPGTGMVAQSINTSDHPVVLTGYKGAVWPQQWNSDGILSSRINDITQGDLYFRTNNGDDSIIKAEEFPDAQGHISPDGAWLAWTQYSAGGSQTYVEAFPPDGGRRLRVEVANGSWPTWSANGTALYVASLNRLMRFPVTNNNGITLGEPTLIRELEMPSDIVFDFYDVSADESRIVLMDITYPEPSVVVLVTNWPEMLP